MRHCDTGLQSGEAGGKKYYKCVVFNRLAR